MLGVFDFEGIGEGEIDFWTDIFEGDLRSSKGGVFIEIFELSDFCDIALSG